MIAKRQLIVIIRNGSNCKKRKKNDRNGNYFGGNLLFRYIFFQFRKFQSLIIVSLLKWIPFVITVNTTSKLKMSYFGWNWQTDIKGFNENYFLTWDRCTEWWLHRVYWVIPFLSAYSYLTSSKHSIFELGSKQLSKKLIWYYFQWFKITVSIMFLLYFCSTLFSWRKSMHLFLDHAFLLISRERNIRCIDASCSKNLWNCWFLLVISWCNSFAYSTGESI